jgi:hypothetical protein
MGATEKRREGAFKRCDPVAIWSAKSRNTPVYASASEHLARWRRIDLRPTQTMRKDEAIGCLVDCFRVAGSRAIGVAAAFLAAAFLAVTSLTALSWPAPAGRSS